MFAIETSNKFVKEDTRVHIIHSENEVNVTSLRIRLFKAKGTKCVCCGLEGNVFIENKAKNDTVYHLNLYHETEDKDLILMTKDHIVPKSAGGEDTLENLQVMCEDCNSMKSSVNDNLAKDQIIEITKNNIKKLKNKQHTSQKTVKMIKRRENLLARLMK